METQIAEYLETQIAEHKDAQVRVLVVDDHVILRQGIRELLNKENDFEVVGEAENEKGALSLNKELKPDIVLVDFALDHSARRVRGRIIQRFSRRRRRLHSDALDGLRSRNSDAPRGRD